MVPGTDGKFEPLGYAVPVALTHDAGHFFQRYSVMPELEDEPSARRCTLISPFAVISGLSALMSGWSQVVIWRVKIFASMQASRSIGAPPSSASGTLWKTLMAPSANGTWSISRPLLRRLL